MVQPYLTQLLAEQHVCDLHEAAQRHRRAKAASAPRRRVSVWSRFRAFMDRGQLGPATAARAEAAAGHVAASHVTPATARCAT